MLPLSSRDRLARQGSRDRIAVLSARDRASLFVAACDDHFDNKTLSRTPHRIRRLWIGCCRIENLTDRNLRQIVVKLGGLYVSRYQNGFAERDLDYSLVVKRTWNTPTL